MGLLQGKVAVVAGGTSGIGAATAELFVAEGARVVIAGRRHAEGEALAARLGPAASFIRTDVGIEPEVAAMIAHAVEKFGRVDCLFNNAGTPGRIQSIAETDMDQFDALVRVHVRGVVLGMKHAAAVMLRQGSGSIVNTGSVAGLRGGLSSHLYSMVKAAVIHLTRAVAMELAEKGIRVNSISPGAIVTGIFAKGAGLPPAVADLSATGLAEMFAGLQPLQIAGMPADVAQAALFLASEASRFVTGQDIVVDGGLTAGQPWSAMLAGRGRMGETIQSLAR